ncbi:hypothetical protein CEXT_614731 [Caerostris extrusa]|uniref:Uncharacterized protein n=1 Tax=Caerostris extrusa TaxID=172846 RepID=A0AAV4P8U9_CAEEX|nr:hypothetical protein CEXT_614731 [Caerostris extrusa]
MCPFKTPVANIKLDVSSSSLIAIRASQHALASQGPFPASDPKKTVRVIYPTGWLMVPDDTPGVVAGASLVSLDQTICRQMLLRTIADLRRHFKNEAWARLGQKECFITRFQLDYRTLITIPMHHYPISPNGINSPQKRFFPSGIFFEISRPITKSIRSQPRTISRECAKENCPVMYPAGWLRPRLHPGSRCRSIHGVVRPADLQANVDDNGRSPASLLRMRLGLVWDFNSITATLITIPMQHYPICLMEIFRPQKRCLRSGIFLKYLAKFQNPYAASQEPLPASDPNKTIRLFIRPDGPGRHPGESLPEHPWCR